MERQCDTLHVSVEECNHSLPSHIDTSELRQLFSLRFGSEIKAVEVVTNSPLQRAGKVTFNLVLSASDAQVALHGKKLPDGNHLNVRYWGKEDEIKNSPKAKTPESDTDSDENCIMIREDLATAKNTDQVCTEGDYFNLLKAEPTPTEPQQDASTSSFSTKEVSTFAVPSTSAMPRKETIISAMPRVLPSCTSAMPRKETVISTMPRIEISTVPRTEVNALPCTSAMPRKGAGTFTIPRMEPISTPPRTEAGVPWMEFTSTMPEAETTMESIPTIPRREGGTSIAQTKERKKSASTKRPRSDSTSKSSTGIKEAYGSDQIILSAVYEPICTSELAQCTKTLKNRFKATSTCKIAPCTPSIKADSQAYLCVGQNRVVTIKIAVGTTLSSETADAVVIPTGKSVGNCRYPIATEPLSLLVDSNGRVINAWYETRTALVEVGQAICSKVENLPFSYAIQVLLPLHEQKSPNSTGCKEAIRNCLTQATKLQLGSIVFPGMNAQIMIKCIVDNLCAIGPTSLHSVSLLLGNESEAREYIVALNHLISNARPSASEHPVPTTSFDMISSSSEELVWSWRESDGSFIPYAPAVMTTLTEAHKKGQESTYFSINGTDYHVNLKTMKQTNLSTFTEREVLKSASYCESTGTTWKYEDDNGYFTPYSPEDSAQIDMLHKHNDQFTCLAIQGRAYRFDFSAMKQINVSTGFKRNIKCSPGGRNDHESSTPVFLCDGEVIVTIHGPLATLTTAKQMLEKKLKDLLFSKTIPHPTSADRPLLSRMQAVARRNKVSYSVEEESKTHKQVIKLQGLKTSVEKTQNRIQELILQSLEKESCTEYPRQWKAMTKDEQVTLVPLLESSPEFEKVSKKFHETMDKSQFLITRIQQVQNKHLWKRYQQSRDRLRDKHSKVNEKELFHGTRDKPATTICESEDGFDMRHSREGMWGWANYFAVKASYSDNYSYHDTSKVTNEMILAKVLTGDSFNSKPDQSLRMPPMKNQGQTGTGRLQQVRYDSVNGMTKGCRVFMTYSNELAYPAFIITYLYIPPQNMPAASPPVHAAVKTSIPPPVKPPPVMQPPPVLPVQPLPSLVQPKPLPTWPPVQTMPSPAPAQPKPLPTRPPVQTMPSPSPVQPKSSSAQQPQRAVKRDQQTEPPPAKRSKSEGSFCTIS